MAEMEWRGDAIAVSELTDVILQVYVPGGRYGLKLYNRPLVEAIAPPLDDETILEPDDGLAAVQASLIAQLEQLSISATATTINGKRAIRLESTPGVSLGIRVQGTAACYVVTSRPGIASTNQTFRIAIPAGASGGTWALTLDLEDEGTETTDAIAYDATEATVATEIEEAADAITAGAGVTCRLIYPGTSTESRVYEVTMAGDFAGMNFTATGDGSTLLGVGSVTCTNVQLAAGQATAIQAITIKLGANPNNGRRWACKFSRDGVASSEVTCEGFSEATFKTLVEDALAEVLGENQVAVTVAGCEQNLQAGSYDRGSGEIVVVVRWLRLGAQTPLTCVYYNNQRNSYPSPTTPFTAQTTVIRESGDNQNEFLLARVVNTSSSGSLTPGDYEVTQDVTTWTINHSYTTTVAQLVTQWEEGTGAGNVDIHDVDAQYNRIYVVEFKGAKAALDQSVVTFTTLGTKLFQVIVDGSPYLNQIDQMIIRADGGTFTASSNGSAFTGSLSYNINAATLQSQLRLLTAIGTGNCTVTGDGTASNPFLIEYISGKAATEMSQLVFNTAATLQGGADPAITQTVAGAVGLAQINQVWLDPNLNGGYIIPILDGVFDSRVAYNGNAAAWESAIETIPNSGCTVVGTGYPFIVTFADVGPRDFDLDQSQATVSTSSLISLQYSQVATGPNHWNESRNWSGAVVPGSDDTPILRDGTTQITEGLNQRCTFTVDTTTGNLIMGSDITNVGHFVPGQKVYLSTTNTFPTATSGGSGITITNATAYYVTAVDQKTRRLQLSLSRGGVAIEFTNAGTGTHTVEVVLTEFQHHATFTGSVGLSRRFQGGLEERPQWLEIGASTAKIGLGDTGSASGRIKLDLGARASAVKQFRSGTSQQQGELATAIRANNTSTTVWVNGGGLAISPEDMNSDTSTVGAVEASRCDLLLGKVSVGSLQTQGVNLMAPFGYTNRGTAVHVK